MYCKAHRTRSRKRSINLGLGNKRFLIRLLASFLILSIVPLLVTVSFVYRSYSQSMIDEVSNTNLVLLGQIQIKVEMMLSQILNLASNTSMDDDIRFFSYHHVTDDIVRLYRLYNSIGRLTDTNTYIDSFFVYFDDYDYVVGARRGEHGYFHYVDSIDDQYWRELYRRHDTGNLRFVERTNESGRYLTLVKPIYSSTSSPRGVQVVETYDSTIVPAIEELRTKNLGRVAIADANGSIVFGDPALSEALDLADTAGDSGNRIVEVNGQQQLLSYSQSMEFGWRFVSLTRLDDVLYARDQIRRLTVFAIVAVVVLICVTSWLFSNHLYHPISGLIAHIREVGALTKPRVNDEMDMIEGSFDQLLASRDRLARFLKENRNLMRDKLLNNLLLGYDYPEPEIIAKLEYLDIKLTNPSYLLLLVSADGSSDHSASQSLDWKLRCMVRAKEVFRAAGVSSVVFETNFENIAIVVNFKDDESEHFVELLPEYTQRLRAFIAGESTQTASIGVSGIVYGVTALHTAYLQAKRALAYRIISGKNTTIFVEDVAQGGRSLLHTQTYEKRLANMVRTQNLDGAYEHIDMVIAEAARTESMTIETTYNAFVQLVASSVRALEDFNASAYEEVSRSDLFTDLLRAKTLEELRQRLRQIYRLLILAVGRTKLPEGNQRVQEVETLLRENYNDSTITLTTAADAVGITAPYLSKIFRAETGKTFSTYLNMLRIERSKQLMQTTDANIYEIARQVGYCNYQSFARFFKRFEGCPPSSYRPLYPSRL